MAFMKKKHNKYFLWIMVALISIGLVGPLSISWLTSSPLQSQAGTGVAASGAEAKGNAYYQEAADLMGKNKAKEAGQKFGQAIAEYESVVKTNPNNTAVLGDLATSYFYTGKTDKAIETVKKALDIDPNFTTARLNYAIYLGDGKGQTREAIKELQKIKSGDPNFDRAKELINTFSKPALPGLKK